MIYQLPTQPVINYGVSREQLIEQAVWFALRGRGLKDEAIERHYHSEVLAVLEA